MNFIKLTNGTIYYVNVDKISFFYHGVDPEITKVFLDDNDEEPLYVRETPEEILELIKNAEKSKTPYPQSISVEIPERFGRKQEEEK